MSKKTAKERYFIAAVIALVPGITADKIRECLRETEGIRISASGLSSILSDMEKAGVIRTRWGGNMHGTWRKCWVEEGQ